MSYEAIFAEANIDQLKSEFPSGHLLAIVLGPDYPLDEAVDFYDWVGTSTATPDDYNYVKPDFTAFNTMGRWVKVDLDIPPQVNTDWNSTGGPANILNKPVLSTVATSGNYTDLSNKPAISNAGISGNYSDLINKPSLATVATSGSYSDLTGKPSIPAAQVNTDWNSSTGLTQLLNKPSLAAVATSGSYTDLSSKPTIPTISTPSQSAVTRTLNSAFQISSTRNAFVSYSIQETVTASITGGQNGDVILEIASDSGFTTNVQTVAIAGVGQSYTLAIALQGVQPQTTCVAGFVPAGCYVRLRTVNNTGTPSYSYRAGQEALLY